MLHSLEFEVSFTSTGKTIKGCHSFQSGLTAITGRNEAGKSLRLEMVRYALWGSKALRSPISSYKTLTVSLEFTVKDQKYKVTRTKTNATLLKDNVQLAVGTTPMNSEIERLFGYNMAVFDTANACLQGQTEALSNMPPSERKRMVDKVIGLDAIDKLIASVSSELSMVKGFVNALESQFKDNLVEPIRPESIYGSLEDAAQELESLVALEIEKVKIETKLNTLKQDKPDEVGEPPIGLLDELKSKASKASLLLEQRKNKELKIRALENELLKKPDVDVTKLERYLSENVEQSWIDWNEYNKKATLFEQTLPKFPKDVLLSFAEYAVRKASWEQAKKLREHTISCPECRCEFPLSLSQIEELEKDCEGVDMETIHTQISQTIYANCKPKVILGDIEILEAYEKFKSEPVVEKPEQEYLGTNSVVSATLRQLDGFRLKSHELELLKEEYSKECMEPIEDISDLNFKIKAQSAWLENYNDYKNKLKKYEEYCEYHSSVADWLKNISSQVDRIPEVKKAVSELETYELALRTYRNEKETQEAVALKIKDGKAQLEELNNVKKALSELKPRVKTYLTPSLNRVASNLLSQMTNGERNVIQVDENFEITVDNQSIEELSGSAKSVTNIALRIGLGTVLTSGVFSVLLADEIDAAMDADRSAYTAECLKNLTKVFSQVILVSHREPEADNHIKL